MIELSLSECEPLQLICQKISFGKSNFFKFFIADLEISLFNIDDGGNIFIIANEEGIILIRDNPPSNLDIKYFDVDVSSKEFADTALAILTIAL